MANPKYSSSEGGNRNVVPLILYVSLVIGTEIRKIGYKWNTFGSNHDYQSIDEASLEPRKTPPYR